MIVADDDVKITVYLKDKNNLLANATVSIPTIEFGYVTIKDFLIWKSNNLNERLQEYINITPPTKQFYGRYHPGVFFEKKDCWYKLEEKIYDAYIKVKNKYHSNGKLDIETVDI
ncbi:MAG: hypothetical protein UT12_C0019G0011 [Candidatus Curtissbacteria bacterium GW2011_GWC2_38_9]|uniref:Uncharacterized protein n=3 Tax=Candidatus Curtissiibacteriota TaxID=1752717 RepID=A0A1F5HSQ3_9BACT|nr:MAG: hypothetical protein UT12_C0019G0011 [Candidatus Curtissbacteria bacterium GW2011_GWC2_38_9]KKS03262.1 MAG: hypothetical protein UU56_C0021G0010 [Candidatus Curtissbacteria bacterium GW2011_GWA2_41_24]OGD90074.1 MAG: hypothetical protein A2Z54_02725 [Candidatus Curtissbacteria bacterium RIFCSPHIGHO2_02_39_8]OGE07218.1 MAG: hypothetical protein A2W70_02170 [Candidatus Curtissbacteria bacterium RIFCSPLOWO2_02_41_11]